MFDAISCFYECTVVHHREVALDPGEPPYIRDGQNALRLEDTTSDLGAVPIRAKVSWPGNS
jgi:hypothetical protein